MLAVSFYKQEDKKMDDIDLFYDENWDGLMFGDGASISAKVGQRLGVPFTRSMQEKVDIQLSFPSSSTCSPRTLSIYQDQAGLTAISGVVWDCALMFADFFMQAYASLSGANDLTTILDIGCGTGVCGIVALNCHQSCTVVFTDKLCSSSLENNLDLLEEQVKERYEFIEYDWSNATLPSRLLDKRYDLLCCSDLLYDKAYHSHLLRLLASLSYREIVFAYKKRHEVEERAFFSQLSQTCKLRVLDAHSLQKINVTEDMTKSGLYIVLAEKLVL